MVWDEAEKQGYDKNKVAVHSGLENFKVGDRVFTYGGSADLKDGTIQIWPEAIAPIGRGLEGLMAHEIAHEKFQVFLTAYEEERSRFGKEEAERYRKDKKGEWTRADDSIKSEFEEQYKQAYPLSYALRDSYQSYEDREKMHTDDGVSDYSRAYWDEYNKARGMTTPTVYHETVAEMARIELETGKLPGSGEWKKLYRVAMDYADKHQPD